MKMEWTFRKMKLRMDRGDNNNESETKFKEEVLMDKSISLRFHEAAIYKEEGQDFLDPHIAWTPTLLFEWVLRRRKILHLIDLTAAVLLLLLAFIEKPCLPFIEVDIRVSFNPTSDVNRLSVKSSGSDVKSGDIQIQCHFRTVPRHSYCARTPVCSSELSIGRKRSPMSLEVPPIRRSVSSVERPDTSLRPLPNRENFESVRGGSAKSSSPTV